MQAGLHLLARVGVNPGTVADVGASDGHWPAFARTVFPGHIWSSSSHSPHIQRHSTGFRPSILTHTSFVARSALNEVRRYSTPLIRLAVSCNKSEQRVVTLDEVLRSAKPPFVVKLDTHGVESEILAGSEQTLRRSVAWIVEAYNHRITPNCMLFWELCEYMAQAGFRSADLVDVLHRPHDGTLWQMDLLFIRSDWDGFDYLGYT